MKYTINNRDVHYDINQPVIQESHTEFIHSEPIDSSVPWFNNGYISAEVSADFIEKIRHFSKRYIEGKIFEAIGIEVDNLDYYHKFILETRHHLKVLSSIGKVINPQLLGIDTIYLKSIIKKMCNIENSLDCRNVCDIRIFRPYNSSQMDNNPLHRDTWLPVLNNCLNVYIPLFGNNSLSSLSVIPGSHIWDRNCIYRTVENAKIQDIQYGLPAIAAIERDFSVIRPELGENQILIFSSNIIHGGALNLNNDLTRASIEIRFWIK